MDSQMFLTIIGFILTCLLAGNVYFVKRLVDRIDTIGLTQNKNDISLTGVKTELTNMNDTLKGVKSDIKDLRKIEIEVAILKNNFINQNERGLT